MMLKWMSRPGMSQQFPFSGRHAVALSLLSSISTHLYVSIFLNNGILKTNFRVLILCMK